MNARIFWRGLLLIASLVALGFILKSTQLGAVFDTAWIDANIRGKGLSGNLLFVGAGIIATAIGLPRQMLAFLGGYAFGLIDGTLLSLAGTVGGCATTFFYARIMGRQFVSTRFPGKIRRIDAFLHDNPFSMTLLIRLLPLGSNLVTNLAAGVSSVQARHFVSGSAVGYIPQMVIFALIGSGITVDTQWRVGVSVVLFVISGMLGVRLYRKYRHGLSIDDDIERELGVGEN